MNPKIPTPFLPLPPPGNNVLHLARHARNQHLQIRTWANKITNQVNKGVGPVLASGPSIVISHEIHHVSGTAPIKTFVPQPGATGSVHLIADGFWQTVTGGNINESIIVTKGRAYHWLFDGTMWFLVM